MCFDQDSRPPVPAIAGGALDARDIELTAADGNRFGAYLARAAEPSGAGIVILPDVRGLHSYFRELALRFAEHGVDAIAIDYFGRTAGIGDRDHEFEYLPHVQQTTYAGLRADIEAAATRLRDEAHGHEPVHDRLLHGRPDGVPHGGVRARARRRHRLLRLADRRRAQRHAGAGRHRRHARGPDPVDLRRRRRGHRPGRPRRLGAGAHRGGRRARDDRLRGRAALVLRPQGRGLRGTSRPPPGTRRWASSGRTRRPRGELPAPAARWRADAEGARGARADRRRARRGGAGPRARAAAGRCRSAWTTT